MEFFLSNLLFPIIIAVVGTLTWNFILEKRRKDEEVYRKLYGPLGLYFSYIDSIDFHLNKIVKIPNIQTREKTEKLGSGNNQTISEYSVKNKMIEEWWLYVDIIKQLLETNAGFIKQEHGQFVYNFIKGYVARQQYGKIHYEKDIPDYLRKYFNKEDENFIHSVNKLKNAILEKQKKKGLVFGGKNDGQNFFDYKNLL
ncbi:hypothetical protein COT65_01785 [Candidatus Shapirobacteria bacterium CG09_land_8_20_14_0_10_47_13]|uniref:DUF4760 domain-containing protein n=1 Tax=Candidatus Shapirobacteria bacterium CG09_land_8_20_14_0_10_47_13 TaxID=1974481 RepID=A0A2H0WMJ7_9BACT|nr:MAG: hypothetical protein COT65_01785 [Candidatus Shapirobacteria bacterium CG09_land_8_20_14_0_10_47_13]